MKKRWVVKQNDIPAIDGMPEYPQLVQRLLALRGITNPTAASEYLNPDYSSLHDPFVFQDMAKAVDRLVTAIQGRQKILIYADYDADAITAASVMTLGLRKLGAEVDCYIPDRFTEGYGMNTEAVQKLVDQGAQLIVTVDCGTNSTAEAELCQQLGVDLIITDHHEITGALPQAFALINPKNPQDSYPFKYLTGVGVAFKVMQALYQQQGNSDVPPGWEKWLLDIVSIGTVADLQSLEGENRTLVYYGLQVLNKSKWPGVRALLEAAKVNAGKFTTYTLGFVVAPRINAAGRIKHAGLAYRLLTAPDMDAARRDAQELDALNAQRQTLTERILSEAREQALQQVDRKVLLAVGDDWPKGVVGLVAGKLAEESGKPVFVMDRGAEFATGSARSFPHFDLVAGLKKSEHLLTKFGGHTQAAGFTLPSKNIDALYANLLKFADELPPPPLEVVLELDAELAPNDYNWENYGWIEKFEPFGFGNPKPKFMGRNLEVVDCRTVGGEGQHLKLRLKWGDKLVEAIAFKQGYWLPRLSAGGLVDVAFEMDANEWNGHKDLQMKIIDIKQGD